MGKTILDIKNVSKSFKGQMVLQDISFSLQQSTIVGLLERMGLAKVPL